jgi:hypothetical protein
VEVLVVREVKVIEGEVFEKKLQLAKVMCGEVDIIYKRCEFFSNIIGSLEEVHDFSNKFPEAMITFDDCSFAHTSTFNGVFTSLRFNRCVPANVTGQNVRTAFFGCVFKDILFLKINNIDRLFSCTFIGCYIEELRAEQLSVSETVFDGCHFYDHLNGSFLGSTFIDCTFASNNNLKGMRDIRSSSFGGCNIAGVQLPDKFNDLAPIIKQHEESTKSAKGLFILLMTMCFYVALSYLIILLLHLGAIDGNEKMELRILPIWRPLEPALFIPATSFMILAVYWYTHVYVTQMWRYIKQLPAIFPDGSVLFDKIYPRIFNYLMWDSITLLKDKKEPSDMKKNKKLAFFAGWWIPFLVTVLGVVAFINCQQYSILEGVSFVVQLCIITAFAWVGDDFVQKIPPGNLAKPGLIARCKGWIATLHSR